MYTYIKLIRITYMYTYVQRTLMCKIDDYLKYWFYILRTCHFHQETAAPETAAPVAAGPNYSGTSLTNIHPWLSSMVNYAQPVHFNGFDAAAGEITSNTSI